ncbi:MAG: hypothetical protein ACKO6F_00465 [Cyanobium sp.]
MNSPVTFLPSTAPITHPSQAAEPCSAFRPGSTVKWRALFTCCDTSRWGKCEFGGGFHSEPGKPLINAFQ